MKWWKRNVETPLADLIDAAFPAINEVARHQEEINRQVRETREAIAAAPTHYLKAEAALKCEVVDGTGHKYFEQEFMTHSALAVIDELRRTHG